MAKKKNLFLADLLNAKVTEYNRPGFIADDPISIPHRFTARPDIEIAGFFAAIFSWGNRTTIIRKSRELMQLMDDAPHQFILGHQDSDLKRVLDFKHRTFNATDLLYFIEFLKQHYTHHNSLEDAFLRADPRPRAELAGPQPLAAFIEFPATASAFLSDNQMTVVTNPPTATPDPSHKTFPLISRAKGQAIPSPAPDLPGFYHYFFSLEDSPSRTRKHIATPEKNSSCKRLNMFLRWMVRKDDKGVDFGIWKKISPASLICPLDVHVGRVARRLGLLTRAGADWQAAQELTDQLRKLDSDDPVKYDFALFGMGVMEKF